MAAPQVATGQSGLHFGGIDVMQYPTLHGVFTLDLEQPVANGRPHYKTAAGGHLYFSLSGYWVLNLKFSPDKGTYAAYSPLTARAMPVGVAVWHFWVGCGTWFDQEITVVEVNKAEVSKVEDALAAPQAAGLRIEGIDMANPKLHGIFTLDLELPVANGRPHYKTAAGGHLYYSTSGCWVL